MRILFVITNSTLCDGISRHILTLVEGFSDNIQIGLCVTHKPGELTERASQMGVRVFSLHCPHGHDPRILPRFKSVLDQFQPDLIHAHVLPFFSGLLLLTVGRNIPLIATQHVICDPKPLKGRLKDLLLRKYGDFVYGHVRRHIMISGPIQESYNQRYPNRKTPQVVCYNAVCTNSMPVKDRDWLLAELGLPKSAILIGMVGRMAEIKDWPAFIEICDLLGENDSYHFIAVGDGPLLDGLRKHELVMKSPGHFHWLGYRSDGKRIIGALDVFLLTSVWEGMPGVVLESFAMRTVVAGFVPGGGVEEILAFEKEMGGRLAALNHERDCRQAANDVLHLIGDLATREAMTQRAYSVVETHFDSKVICKQLERMYFEVLSE